MKQTEVLKVILDGVQRNFPLPEGARVVLVTRGDTPILVVQRTDSRGECEHLAGWIAPESWRVEDIAS